MDIQLGLVNSFLEISYPKRDHSFQSVHQGYPFLFTKFPNGVTTSKILSRLDLVQSCKGTLLTVLVLGQWTQFGTVSLDPFREFFPKNTYIRTIILDSVFWRFW